MIHVEHLKKQYAATTAVNDISFQVAKSEVLGFLGPNGAGKTTTLRILTGYLAATSGKVTVDGNDVFTAPEAVKRVIGYLPENVPLYHELRVQEYLSYRAALKQVPRARRRAAVNKAMERCEIQGVRQRIIGQISKGYRQRVGLADALLGDPKILILDEPTIGLDPNQIRQVRELITELGKDHTVILSSHILPEVEAVCSRVIIIHNGRLVSQGKPDELRASLRGDSAAITVEVKDSPNDFALPLGNVEGVKEVSEPIKTGGGFSTYTIAAVADPGVRERIFDAAVQGGFKLVGLSSKEASLEDIFVQIITSENEETSSDNSDETGGDA